MDSHERTRFTSALCHDELREHVDARALQVLVPVSFDECLDPNHSRNMVYSSLRKFSSAVGSVPWHDSINLTSDDLCQLVTQPGHGQFWQYPPTKRPIDAYAEFYVPGVTERPRWFVGGGADLSAIDRSCTDTQRLCRWITPDDDGVWNFFLVPTFVEEFACAVGECLDLEKYDYLIGVGHLGTALAISLAYHYKAIFKGSLLSHLGRHGFIPQPATLRNKNVLPIEMRVDTGVYAVDVFQRVKALAGMINEYVSVFPPREPTSLTMRSRQTSIRHLIDRGVRFRSFA